MNHHYGCLVFTGDDAFGASDARPVRSRALPALDVLTSVFGFRGSGSGGSGGNVNDRLALGNFATGGVIGTAAATVDNYAQFIINQTTAAQTLSLPTPTAASTETSVVVSNGGTVPFTMHGKILPVNGSAIFVWNTNSASWLDPMAWMVPLTVSPSVSGDLCTKPELDAHDQFNVNPGDADLDLTLPDPTANQTGKLVRVSNVGVDQFTMYGVVIQDGVNASNPGYAEFSWNGLNWLPAATVNVPFGASGASHSSGDVPDPGAVAGTDRFLCENATWRTVAGSTRLALGNFASGGAIGTAADTVDKKTFIIINQTTASQTLSLPNPTVSGTGTSIVISNNGSTSFAMHGKTIPPNGSAVFVWDIDTAVWLDPPSWMLPVLVTLAVGPAISGAAVDGYDTIHLNGTSPGLAFTLPSPSGTQTGKRLRIVNVGSNSYTVNGSTIAAGTWAEFSWTGAVWAVPASSGGGSSAPTWTVTPIKIANYSAAIGEWVRTDPTAGAFNVSLPASDGGTAGQTIVVSNESDVATTVTVLPDGTDTIGGQASYLLSMPRGEIMFVDSGDGNWMLGG